MKLLHVHSGNLYGGVETTLLAQVRHIDLCPAMKLSFALCFEGRFSEELIDAGASVHWLGQARVRHPLSIRRVRRQLVDYLRRERFDAVVTHSAWSQAIFGPAIRSATVPLVFCLHDVARGRHWLERWARLTPPDLALCNSHFTAGTLAKLYPRTRAEVVYNPYVSSEIHQPPGSRSSLRAELNTPEDAIVVVQVSRMEPMKGHALHLEALSLLKDIPDWVCWMIGGAQRPHEIRYMGNLRKLAVKLGIEDRVRFPGQRSDVASLLAAADIYSQPNTAPESFGLTFIEALSAGLPVVTTSLGGAKEILDDSCSVLVSPDKSALASTLASLIQDRELRFKLGAAGPARAQQLCDVGEQLRKINHLVSSLLQHDTSDKYFAGSRINKSSCPL